MLEKNFVPYELALRLKKLGFDEPCFGRYWHEDFKLINIHEQFKKPDYACLAPTFSQAFRWIREKYEYYFWVEPCSEHKIFHFNITCSPSSFTYWTLNQEKPNAGVFKSYEEAELVCLEKLIEILENKKIDNETN